MSSGQGLAPGDPLIQGASSWSIHWKARTVSVPVLIGGLTPCHLLVRKREMIMSEFYNGDVMAGLSRQIHEARSLPTFPSPCPMQMLTKHWFCHPLKRRSGSASRSPGDPTQAGEAKAVSEGTSPLEGPRAPLFGPVSRTLYPSRLHSPSDFPRCVLASPFWPRFQSATNPVRGEGSQRGKQDLEGPR